jgi:hypothetical protein
MQALAVVHFLDEKGKSILDIFKGSVFPEIDFLDFNGFEKALGGGVVVRIAFPRHADLESMLIEDFNIVMGSILDSPVGVMNDPLGRITMRDGHLKGLKT